MTNSRRSTALPVALLLVGGAGCASPRTPGAAAVQVGEPLAIQPANSSNCGTFGVLTDDQEHYPMEVKEPFHMSMVWLRNGGSQRLAQDVDCPLGGEFCKVAGMRWYLYEIEVSRDGTSWVKGVYWAPNDAKLQDVFPSLRDGPACFILPQYYDPGSLDSLHYYVTY